MNVRDEKHEMDHSIDVAGSRGRHVHDSGLFSGMVRGWNLRFYQVGERFGRPGYRTNIVRVEKLTALGWLAASVAGRLLCLLWAVALVGGRASSFASWRVLVPGTMLWLFGEFFSQAANRGILYHHMDFLAEWLDRRSDERQVIEKCGTGGGTSHG